MNKPNLFQQAQEGNPAAVATLMNQSLNPKGIHAKVAARGDRLFVRLESQTPPDQTLLTKFVQSGIQNLSPASYKTVEVSGKSIESDRPAWTSVIDLAQQTITQKPASPTPSPPAPPPPPPTVSSRPESSRPKSAFSSPPSDLSESQSSSEAVKTSDEASEIPKTQLQRDTFIPEHQRGRSEEQAAAMSQSEEQSDEDFEGTSEEDVIWDEADPHFYDTNADQDYLSSDETENTELSTERRSRSLVPTELPGPIDFSSPSSSKSSAANGILFVSVLLVLLGVTGGLIGYALWSYLDSGGSISDPGLTPSPSVESEENEMSEDSEQDPSPTEANARPQMSPTELLQEAGEKADSASTLAQTAQSGDDWSLVASQWQRAVTSLESIPEGSPEYAEAQQRLATYRSQLANAQQQAENLSSVASAPLPSTVVTTNREPECEAIASGNNAQPLQLSAVRFDESGNGTGPIAGCITNNSEQAIASATIEYVVPAASSPDAAPEGETPTPTPMRTEIQFSNLEPGATVPFSASLQIPEDQAGVQITGITWTPAGASESQSSSVSIPLSAQ